jgi:hypothetical protein
LRRGDKGGEARAFGGREKEFSERKEGFGGQKSFSGGRKILSGALASHLDEEERCFNGLERLSRAMFLLLSLRALQGVAIQSGALWALPMLRLD